MKLLSLLNAAATPAATTTDWHATEPWVRYGMRTVTQLCGGLLLGSILFSVAGAVVASGTVSVDGDYKTVQHLEGGIVSKILVHNGDRVKEGQVLVQLGVGFVLCRVGTIVRGKLQMIGGGLRCHNQLVEVRLGHGLG